MSPQQRSKEQPLTIYLDDPGAGSENSVQSERIKALFRGRMHLAIGLAAVLGIVLAVAGWMTVKPIFQSEAVITMQEVVDPLSGRSESPGAMEVDRQRALLRSSPVIQRAVADTRLHDVAGEEFQSQGAVGQFRSVVTTYSGRRDPNITVFFTHENSQVARVGLQVLMDAYMETVREQQSQRNDEYIEEISGSRFQVIAEIRNIEEQLRRYQEEFDTTNLRDRIRLLEVRQLELDTLIGQLESEIEQRNELIAGGGDESTVPTTFEDWSAHDLLLQQLEQTRRAAEREYVYHRDTYGSQHRITLDHQRVLDSTVAEIEFRVQELNRMMVESPELLPLGNNRPLEQLIAEREGLQDQRGDVEALLSRMRRAEYEIDRLEQSRASKEDRLARLDTRIFDVQNDSSLPLPVEVVSAASEPSIDNSSAKLRQAAIGMFLGCVVGFGLIGLLGLIDSRVRRADDVAPGLPSAKMLGLLPDLGQEPSTSTHAHLSAQAIHQVRTRLQVATDPGYRVIAVTSPEAGSGKTTATAALALSFAASRNRTLLIDLDVVSAEITRRTSQMIREHLSSVLAQRGVITPEVAKQAETEAQSSNQRMDEFVVDRGYVSAQDAADLFELDGPDAIGLLDALHGDPLEECVSQTGIPGLDILPVGSATPEEAGSLNPAELSDLFDRACQAYDVVLVDTGPVLGSLEAGVAASQAAGVLMVVKRGEDRKTTHDTLHKLATLGANLLGMVYNLAVDEDLERSSYWVSSATSTRRADAPEKVAGMMPARAARTLGPLAEVVSKHTQMKARRTRGGNRPGPNSSQNKNSGMNLAS